MIAKVCSLAVLLTFVAFSTQQTINLPIDDIEGAIGWFGLGNQGGQPAFNGYEPGAPLGWTDGRYLQFEDAFDGAMMCYIGSTPFSLPSPQVINRVVDKTYRSDFIVIDNIYRVFYELQVQDTNPGLCRGYISVQNLAAGTVTQSITCISNLGTDALTQITQTSSGDNVWTTADRYVVTSDGLNGNVTGAKPLVATIYNGIGGISPSAILNNIAGSAAAGFRYNLTFAPNQRRAILYYVQMASSIQEMSDNFLPKFDNLETLIDPPNYLSQLTQIEVDNIANWRTVIVTASPTRTPISQPALISHTRTQTTTGTGSVSFSSTKSASASPTSARSADETHTRTQTTTGTGSVSFSSTKSVSASPTSARSADETRSNTQTTTGTATHTRTQTTSRTGSVSFSSTGAITLTTTLSLTSTTSQTTATTPTISTTPSAAISPDSSTKYEHLWIVWVVLILAIAYTLVILIVAIAAIVIVRTVTKSGSQSQNQSTFIPLEPMELKGPPAKVLYDEY